MLNFNIQKNQEYSCRQTVIVEVAKYLGANYEMIALGNWRFDYCHSTDKSIGEKLAQIYPMHYIWNMEHYHGLRLQRTQTDNFNVKDAIFHNLELGRPVIVHSDTFYCPWYVGYKRIHYSHFFIIIGCKNGVYQCYDPTMCNNLVEAQDHILLEGIDELITIEQVYAVSHKANEYLEQLQKDVKTNIGKEFSIGMRAFSEDIAQRFDAAAEYEEFRADIDTAPLIDNIRDLFVYRIGYANLLHYLADIVSPKLDTYACNMIDCAKAWKTLRGRFIKLALRKETKQEILDDLSQTILNICEKEMHLAEEITLFF